MAIAIGGKGNAKIGKNVYTFSTTPGLPETGGTCPGASEWCIAHCYAARLTRYPSAAARWAENAIAVDGGGMPEIPAKAKSYRVHVAGDFDSVEYIDAWAALAASRPDVQFWAYTRSWRVAALVPALDALRALPNMQVFASVDPSIEERPEGWRVAFIDDDSRYSGFQCPEQTGDKASCEACGYCFRGQRGNVRFKTH